MKQNIKTILRNNFYMLRRIYRYRPSHFYITLFTTILGSITPVISLYLTRYILNTIMAGTGEERLFSKVALLIMLMGIYNLIVLVMNSWLQQRIIPKNTQVIHQKMQLEMFEKATEVELKCFEDAEFYDKFSMALQQSDSRAMGVLNTVVGFLGNLFGIGALGTMIGTLEPLIIWVVLINVAISFVINSRTMKIQHEQTKERIPIGRETGYSQAIFFSREYAKELRLYQQFAGILREKYNLATEKMLQLIEKYGKRFQRYSVAQGTVGTIINSLIMLFLAAKVIVGKLLIGDYVTVSSGAQQLGARISGLLSSFPQLYEHSLYIDNYRDFMEYQPEMKLRKGAPIEEFKELEINNVSFTYPKTDKQVLSEINFHISTGERVAIVGRNGCGKSTLVKLITRLYDPDVGQLQVNGVDYQTCEVASLRSHIGVVFQDYRTFAGTIAENVLMREPTEEDTNLVWDALRFVGLYEKVASLPDGINSKLTREFDNRGVFLSGGEFQKLALARVYARECSLIILDEPSSALDPISEREMFSAMKRISDHRCAIMISHRLTNIQNADRIYVMDEGKIVEIGSHKELMMINGLYADMYHKQTANLS